MSTSGIRIYTQINVFVVVVNVNPTKPYIDLFTPRNPSLSTAEVEWYRTILHLTVFGLVVGIYSVFKWWRLDYAPLMSTSILLIMLMVASCCMIRFSVRVDVCATVFILGFSVHACNMSFQTGGLNSSHIFWPLTVISFAYLFSSAKFAFGWALIMAAYVVYLMLADFQCYALPDFQMPESAAKADRITGFMLPLLVTWLAQYYGNKLRSAATMHAEKMATNAEAKTIRSTAKIQEVLTPDCGCVP